MAGELCTSNSASTPTAKTNDADYTLLLYLPTTESVTDRLFGLNVCEGFARVIGHFCVLHEQDAGATLTS